MSQRHSHVRRPDPLGPARDRDVQPAARSADATGRSGAGAFRLVVAGHTNTQIARRLGVSEATVRTHLENIYRRLQVSSRAAAVTRAFPDRIAG